MMGIRQLRKYRHDIVKDAHGPGSCDGRLCAAHVKSYRLVARSTTDGPCMPAFRCFAAAAAILCLLAATAAPMAAATCADLPVTARGDPSGFETLAKAKARGNWRAKVRAIPTLGAAYADWSKALAADYRCGQEGGQHVCTAVAYPCRD